MSFINYDVIIIGAGLVGLATAFKIKVGNPHRKVLVIEKEADISMHQSGHNSGVIHSGIYYKPNSEKARNCIHGYNLLLDFTEKYSIPFDICGKIIVATSQDEIPMLQNIYKRGIENGLQDLKMLSKSEVTEKEPYVAGLAGIFVPQTGIVNYVDVAQQLFNVFTLEMGGHVVFNEEVKSIVSESETSIIETTKASYQCKFMVSCAGLHSDRITAMTESCNDLRIIPFRGEYYKLKPEKEYLVNNLIYPVPDPNFPFLGVHFTRMMEGGIEAGPNAVLAFKREGYTFKSFNLEDSMSTFTWPGYWKLVAKYGNVGVGEIYRSLFKSAFTKSLRKLIPEIQESDLVPGGAGVRAQACDRKGNLIDDFNIVQNKNIIHVRNAPSPAATSCLSIGKNISEMLL